MTCKTLSLYWGNKYVPQCYWRCGYFPTKKLSAGSGSRHVTAKTRRQRSLDRVHDETQLLEEINAIVADLMGVSSPTDNTDRKRLARRAASLLGQYEELDSARANLKEALSYLEEAVTTNRRLRTAEKRQQRMQREQERIIRAIAWHKEQERIAIDLLLFGE